MYPGGGHGAIVAHVTMSVNRTGPMTDILHRAVHPAVSTAHNPVESGSWLPVHGIREHAGGT
jgi:hypothetical protein